MIRLTKGIGYYSKKAFGLGLLPDFIILGAMKCGTTTLYFNLTQHPLVLPASRKEIHFFSSRFHRGTRWYRANFPSVLYRKLSSRAFVTGEASPYYLFHPHSPRRVRETVPQAKLIVLLRNPIERAYSHYHHAVRAGWETLSFEEALAKEEERLKGKREKTLADPTYKSHELRFNSYKARGLYVDQIQDWMEFFPREQLLILKTEEYYEKSGEVMKRVEDFLGLTHWNGFRHVQYNVGGYDSKMNENTRDELREFFEPHNRRLYAFLGEDWGWE